MKYITLTLALLSVGAEAIRLQSSTKFGFSMPSIDLSAITEAIPAELPTDLESISAVAGAAGLEVPTDLNALAGAAGVELPDQVAGLASGITSVDDLTSLAGQATDL